MQETKIGRTDHNLVVKMEATRYLQQLIAAASDGSFSGHVEIKIHAKNGRLQLVEKDCREYVRYEENSS